VFLPLYEKNRDLITMPIANDRLVIAHPIDDPLLGRKNVTLQEIADRAFVDFQLDKGTRRIVDRTFSALGLVRKSALEVGDVQVLLDLVARGFGIALVPHTFAKARAAIETMPSIGIASLGGPAIRWDLVAAFNRKASAAQSRNPAVAAFTEILTKVRVERRQFLVANQEPSVLIPG
jgi:DNA-binding transcriptional LysR family regulator